MFFSSFLIANAQFPSSLFPYEEFSPQRGEERVFAKGDFNDNALSGEGGLKDTNPFALILARISTKRRQPKISADSFAAEDEDDVSVLYPLEREADEVDQDTNELMDDIQNDERTVS